MRMTVLLGELGKTQKQKVSVGLRVLSLREIAKKTFEQQPKNLKTPGEALGQNQEQRTTTKTWSADSQSTWRNNTRPSWEWPQKPKATTTHEKQWGWHSQSAEPPAQRTSSQATTTQGKQWTQHNEQYTKPNPSTTPKAGNRQLTPASAPSWHQPRTMETI